MLFFSSIHLANKCQDKIVTSILLWSDSAVFFLSSLFLFLSFFLFFMFIASLGVFCCWCCGCFRFVYHCCCFFIFFDIWVLFSVVFAYIRPCSSLSLNFLFFSRLLLLFVCVFQPLCYVLLISLYIMNISFVFLTRLSLFFLLAYSISFVSPHLPFYTSPSLYLSIYLSTRIYLPINLSISLFSSLLLLPPSFPTVQVPPIKWLRHGGAGTHNSFPKGLFITNFKRKDSALPGRGVVTSSTDFRGAVL